MRQTGDEQGGELQESQQCDWINLPSTRGWFVTVTTKPGHPQCSPLEPLTKTPRFISMSAHVLVAGTDAMVCGSGRGVGIPLTQATRPTVPGDPGAYWRKSSKERLNLSRVLVHGHQRIFKTQMRVWGDGTAGKGACS